MISCYNSRYAKTVNLKNVWLQLFFYNRKRVIHQTGGCNWNSKLTQYLSNTCQIHCIYAITGCKCSFKKPYSLRNGWPQLLLWNKETLHPEKSCSLRLKAVTFKEIFYELLFHLDIWTSASKCSSMLFQRSKIDRVRPRKHLLVQIQQQRH